MVRTEETSHHGDVTVTACSAKAKAKAKAAHTFFVTPFRKIVIELWTVVG